MLEQQINPPAVFGEREAGHAAKIRRVLAQLAGNISQSTFDVAELLYEAKTNLYFRQWGYESFQDYASKELGIKARKAHYLTRIVYVCKQLGIPRPQYEKVGLTKLREITRLDPEALWFNPKTETNEPVSEHIIRLLAEALDAPTDKIEAEVNAILGLTGEDELVFIPAYRVKRSVKSKIIDVAQELARRMLGSAGRDEETGQAVDYSTGAVEEVIHADFIVGNQDTNTGEDNDGHSPNSGEQSVSVLRSELDVQEGTANVSLEPEEPSGDRLPGTKSAEGNTAQDAESGTEGITI